MLVNAYEDFVLHYAHHFSEGENFMRVTILTNGPGELWGWVRPVASELRKRGHSISLWLLPCPFSSGHEREAASLLGVDKLEGPSSASTTWSEIANENTDSIIQAGGDISFGLRMSKSANAPLTVYSYRHRKDIPSAKLLTAYHEQVNLESVTAIGDLVKDGVKMDITQQGLSSWDWYKDKKSPRILILPGSRPKIRSAVIKWLCELRDSIFPSLGWRACEGGGRRKKLTKPPPLVVHVYSFFVYGICSTVVTVSSSVSSGSSGFPLMTLFCSELGNSYSASVVVRIKALVRVANVFS